MKWWVRSREVPAKPSHIITLYNMIWKVYSLEYTHIVNVFFTPGHLGRCCTGAIQSSVKNALTHRLERLSGKLKDNGHSIVLFEMMMFSGHYAIVWSRDCVLIVSVVDCQIRNREGQKYLFCQACLSKLVHVRYSGCKITMDWNLNSRCTNWCMKFY